MKLQRLKDMAAVFIIVFLLPYVTSVIISGIPKKDAKKAENVGQTVCVAYENREETISLQKYLIGMLAAQVPVNYESETLKAHAVLVRTYYELHEKNLEVVEADSGAWNYLSEEQMKNLWGEDFEANYRRLERAVAETGNECLYYKGKLAEPYFHAVSAGKTRNGTEVFHSERYAYLSSVSCEKDIRADNYVTIKTFTKEELKEILQQMGTAVTEEAVSDPVGWFEISARDAAGYVTEIKVNQLVMHGENFRTALQLPSGAFVIEEWEDGVRFVCKGLGHGFGMSLYTANELAKEGKSHDEILSCFFADIDLEPYG